jgi:hypothetical protein
MKATLLISTFTFLISATVFGQITVDLSKDNVSSETIDINLKPLVIVKNMLPANATNKYSFSIEMKEEKIPAFSNIGSTAGQSCTDNNDTKAYGEALKNLNAAKDETEMPKLIKNLQKEIDNLNSKYQSCKDEGNSIIQTTTYTKDLQFSLRNNQTISVNVTREFKTKEGKDTSKIWAFTFKTPTKSPWSIMYGFTFIPNLMNPMINYYSKADTSGKLFTIIRLNNQRNDFLKNISPTLMLTWKPLKKYTLKGDERDWTALLSNNFYQLGFTGGLSLNFASETGTVNVMAGPSIVIADNISISIGVAATQKNVLKGQYKEGDVIKENLDFDQLHEKKYMAEWFVSIAIRFDQSPFAKKDDATKN